MLDIALLREKYDEVCKKIRTRNNEYKELDKFLEIDKNWRTIVNKIQSLNAERNLFSKQIEDLIKANKKNEIEPIKNKVISIKQELVDLAKKEEEYSIQLKNILSLIPNIPDSSVHIGKDENDNKEILKWGNIPNFKFTPLPHWELAAKNDLADFERASKLSGSRHTIFKNDGAKLMRAIRNFTLDCAAKNGFSELQPPILINKNILHGTGHLPKAIDDMFALTNDQFLSPTEEVPLTGYYSNEIINEDKLPIKLTSSTLSFRSEAGSAGKDMRGVIRQHQFYNTELVILCKPEDSFKYLEMMTNNAQDILKKLKLPFHTILLCTGDMGFASCKTYDIEVWFPCNNKYREISSCSNCLDFQARSSMIKYRLNNDPNNSHFVHTLNGTATSLNRLWVAIVENYQQKDGSIKIPTVLVPYMNGQKFIGKITKTKKKVKKSKK